MQSNKKGFTLIELLIVVVIIGILAAIAIPKFANTKEKAYLAAMKSDLRNLVTAEEAYFSEGALYTPVTAVYGTATVPAALKYSTSTGVSVTGLANAGISFTATATHTATTKTCYIAVGIGTQEGEPLCP
ncbi:MAG: type IV pilin protein [Gemmatimonadaceae bacterium]